MPCSRVKVIKQQEVIKSKREGRLPEALGVLVLIRGLERQAQVLQAVTLRYVSTFHGLIVVGRGGVVHRQALVVEAGFQIFGQSLVED